MICAIETSCDEVSVSLVDENFMVIKNIIYSSSAKANETGGVVPEIAAREAAQMMTNVLKEATENINLDDITAIAVTNGPGLVGSLLTGIESAKALALIYNKPLIPVFHIFGHMCANLLDRSENFIFPCIVLTVSGGHNDIYIWESELEYTRVGKTIDDAAGECFDKCARMLGLGYPGGPLLSKKAEKGDGKRFNFPRPLQHAKNENIYNFSFSGLKTALLYKIKDLGGIENCDEQTIADLAASIETAICESLLHKLFLVQKRYEISHVALTGGVSANTPLRKQFIKISKEKKLEYSIPEKIIYSTDNAAMIGAAAQVLWRNKKEGESFDFRDVRVSF